MVSATATATPHHPPTRERHDQTGHGEQRVVLWGVSWDTYESLLTDHRDRSSPRFAYDRGVLEIVSPLPEHERRNRLLSTVVLVVAEETQIDIADLGSTTFRRRDLARGFEPDSCFYVRHEASVRGRTEIDLLTDPPPDLVIEIDLTHSSLDKLPLYARLGMPEVWRDDGTRVLILVRRPDGDGYIEAAASPTFPVLTADALGRWLGEGLTGPSTSWMAAFRTWVRERLNQDGTTGPA